MRRRGLTESDRRAWADYVQRVAPLAGVTAVVLEATTETSARPASPPPAPTPVPVPTRRSLAPLEIGTSPGGVDRSTWTRFRGGKLAPQRTLDLHGRTVQRAHAELHAFFGTAMAERLRVRRDHHRARQRRDRRCTPARGSHSGSTRRRCAPSS